MNTWKIDPSQSKIAFKVGYMQIGVITGEFRAFEGQVEYDYTFEGVSIEIAVDSRSLTTFHFLRDKGVLGADVFDTDNFPVILFTSTSFRRVSSGGLFELSGLLTIKGRMAMIQAMVSLASFSLVNAVFKFSGSLSRKAFGLGGPGTPDQESVADVVEFFGEISVH